MVREPQTSSKTTGALPPHSYTKVALVFSECEMNEQASPKVFHT